MSENVWFTSDLHLGHNNIRKLCGRPFNTLDEMNRALIENYNALVEPDDLVYILGDLSFKCRKREANELISQLNGQKVLILGNHDIPYDKSLFYAILDYLEFKYDEFQFVLMHYPLMEWNRQSKGSIHVHGHVHSTGEYNQRNRLEGIRRYDVGVDANHFYPISIDEIIEFFPPIDSDKLMKHL